MRLITSWIHIQVQVFRNIWKKKKTFKVLIYELLHICTMIAHTLHVHSRLPWQHIQHRKWVTAKKPSEVKSYVSLLTANPASWDITQKERWEKTLKATAVLVKGWHRRLGEHGDLSLTRDRGEDNPLTSSVSRKGQKCLIVTKVTMKM